MSATQVEALEEVERCFVHIDFQIREEPEHKVRRPHYHAVGI